MCTDCASKSLLELAFEATVHRNHCSSSLSKPLYIETTARARFRGRCVLEIIARARFPGRCALELAARPSLLSKLIHRHRPCSVQLALCSFSSAFKALCKSSIHIYIYIYIYNQYASRNPAALKEGSKPFSNKGHRIRIP